MPLIKPITKHGNSAGVILEQTILKILGWEVGTEVEIHLKEDSILLKRHIAPPFSRRSTDRGAEE
jgi:antitoxin component of MazEF toxin-antitoxin module